LLLALACVLASLLLGVPCAYALARSRSRWARLFEELLTLPVAVPGLASALALILSYGALQGFRQSFAFILVGHLVFTLPFMVRSVSAALQPPRWWRSKKRPARWARASRSAFSACWCLPCCRPSWPAA
jgi:putative spermidine/putrescine transport system permease protein